MLVDDIFYNQCVEILCTHPYTVTYTTKRTHTYENPTIFLAFLETAVSAKSTAIYILYGTSCVSETGLSLGSPLCVFINSGFLCLSLCLRIVEFLPLYLRDFEFCFIVSVFERVVSSSDSHHVNKRI